MEIEASPVEAISGLAAADPDRVAEEALARVNSNASRNSYLTVDQTWTLDQASRLTQRTTDMRQLLYGLPIALKDCFDLEGFVTTAVRASTRAAILPQPRIHGSQHNSRLPAQ